MPRPAPVTMMDLPSSDVPWLMDASLFRHSGRELTRNRIPGLVLADHPGMTDYFSFVNMIVPDAANMPPTPWQTEIFAP